MVLLHLLSIAAVSGRNIRQGRIQKMSANTMNKKELRAEMKRLVSLGLNEKRICDPHAVVAVTKKLQDERCNPWLAVKIAEYEQIVAIAATTAEENSCYFGDIDFEGDGATFSVGGVEGSELDVSLEVMDALRDCDSRVRDAYAELALALTDAYECLYPLWIKEDSGKVESIFATANR